MSDRSDELTAEPGAWIVHDVVMTEGVHWVDGSNHVFRSTEFDVFAEGDDWDSALQAFGDTLAEYHADLFTLVNSGEATPHEKETFQKLTERLLEASRRRDSERERLIAINFRRRRRLRRNWRSAHENSSLVLNA